MKKILGVAGAAVLTLTVLAGCGGNSTSNALGGSGGNTGGNTKGTTNTGGTGDSGGSGGITATGNYCSDLKSAKAAFSNFNGQDFEKLDFTQLSTVLHSVSAEAPSSVSSDWATIANALDSFTNGLRKAGLDPSNLSDLASGSVSPAQLQQLETAAKALESSGVNKASANIDKEVTADCSFALGF